MQQLHLTDKGDKFLILLLSKIFARMHCTCIILVAILWTYSVLANCQFYRPDNFNSQVTANSAVKTSVRSSNCTNCTV